jgi:RimJ/RimL family protein N-acetyltransferase
MEISFNGIVLRPWSIKDADDIARILNNKNIIDNLRDGLPFPYSPRDAINWLNIILPENIPPRFFAITLDNKIVGSIAVVSKTDIYRKNFEIGYYLDENFWGKGIMTKALKAIVDYAFGNFDIIRIYAEVYGDNLGSRRALEKAGFILEATLKKNIIKNEVIKNSCIYSILRENF